MASTYVNDLRLNEMATGDASGSWGTVTNTNLELIGEAFSYGTETIGDADSTLTIADGAADAARSFYLKITSSVDLTTTRIVTLGPNTVSKVWMIENATTGSQVITIKQGSGATINVPNGQVKMISTDGAGSGGAVLDLLVDVDLTGTTTAVNLDVSGTVDIAGDLTLSAGGDGALRFTAASSVKVLDNNAAALVFEEADNAYMTFVTTDGSEAVKFDKALDINAATQIDATVTVGVDDTGYDVKFFGATAGKYMLWDESADTLEVSGTVVAAAGTALLPSITTTGDLNTGMWFPAADTIAFSEGGVEALRIDSSGNVGIGTSSPDRVLHLNNSGTEQNVRAKFTNGTTGEGASDGFEIGINASNPAEVVLVNYEASPMAFFTSGSERMRVTSGGTLQIAGGGNDNVGEINMGNTAQNASRFQVRHQSSAWYLKTVDSEPLILGTANTERMRIDSSGNVGIGTSSPSAKLDVAGPASITSFTGTTELGIVVQGSTGATDYSGIDFKGFSQVNPVARIGALTAALGSQLSFGTSNDYASGITNTAMTIDSAGNVGIGTSSPTAKLTVNDANDIPIRIGDIMAITTTWTIAQLERNTSDGGVTTVHWRVSAVDGDYTASAYGTVGCTPDPEAADWIAFDALTEADVLAWVWASVDKDTTEASLAAKIEADKNPTSATGMPWAAE
jgi:hypothetical protein